MKKRIPRMQIPGRNAYEAHGVKTGEHCPMTGWWVPAGREGNGHYIAEGSMMPSDSGQSITWTLVVVAHVGCQKHADSPAGASLKITSPPYARNAVGQQQRAAEVVISRPETLSVQSAGLSVPGLPSNQVGCEEGCHYCEGPETD